MDEMKSRVFALINSKETGVAVMDARMGPKLA